MGTINLIWVKLLLVGFHDLDRGLVDLVKYALLDFKLSLLVHFISTVDLILAPLVVKGIVTLVAETLSINLAMSVSTLGSLIVSTVHVIAVVAHALSIMLLVLVRAIGYLRDFPSLANHYGLLKFVLFHLLNLLRLFLLLARNLVFDRNHALNLLDLG